MWLSRELLGLDASCRLYCAEADSKRNQWGLLDGGAKPDRSRNAADTYLVELQGHCDRTMKIDQWYLILEVARNQPMPSLRHDDVLEEDISVTVVIISRQNYTSSIVEYVIFTVDASSWKHMQQHAQDDHKVFFLFYCLMLAVIL